MITFKVRCPRCLQFMNYQPRQGDISSKTKRCVYCGTIFKVHGERSERVHKIMIS
jgi:hypothetical protein